jgi:predicted RecB family nuclease
VPVLTAYSQGSLQDYQECQRRFYLRYLLRLAWPALEVEPVEEHEREMAQGAAFHRLIQQHLLGVPAERLSQMNQDETLAVWWQAYLGFVHPDLSGIRPDPAIRLYPEISLSAPLAGARLLAKFDLIAVYPDGRAIIYDWKTSRRLPGRQKLIARTQTRVYRYVLVQAGAAINSGKSFQPAPINMVYWFAGFPGAEERLAYDAAQFTRDGQDLGHLMTEIQGLTEPEFTLTSDERRCRFCTYRSLCDRGTHAGGLDDEQENESDRAGEVGTLDTDLDFDTIAEIGL